MKGAFFLSQSLFFRTYATLGFIFNTILFQLEVSSYPYLKNESMLYVSALQWLWQKEDVKLELEDMQKERESSQEKRPRTVKDLLSSRCVRWQLLTLIIPCAGGQLSGNSAVCLLQFSYL